MMNRARYIVLKVFCVLPVLALLFTASCASPSGNYNRPAYVMVDASGIMHLNGDPVSLGQLGPQLKRKGYGQRSPVNVHYVEPISKRMRLTIITALRKSGFIRVAFIGPKTISTDVSNRRTPTPK